MSETTPSTYEVRRSSAESIPAGLRLNKLDGLVSLDQDARADYARDKENIQASYEEYVDALIAVRLRQNGIEDVANDESQHAEYEYAKGLYTNVSKLSEVEWLTTPPDVDVKRRTLVLRELLDRYDHDQTPTKSPETKTDEEKPADALTEPKATGVVDDDESATTVITPEQLKNMDLEALAKAKHEAFAAKLNAPVFGKKRKELMDAYVVTEQAYLTALRTHLENQVDAEFPDGTGDRAALRLFIEQEVNARARTDEAAQRDALIEQGGTRAKFLNWYANQSRGKKILVGIGAGVGLGVVGVGLGALAGLAGGAAGAIAGGAMLGSRFGRGYAMRMSAIYKKPTKQPEFAIQDDSDEGTNGFYDQSTSFMSKISREQIKHAEDIKKSAVVIAMGTVALGGMIGTGIHMAGIAGEAANDHWIAGYLQHRENWDFNNDVNPIDTPTVPGSGTTNSGGLDTNPSDNEGYNPNPNQNPQKPDFKILGSDERTISKGEGWYETLREMGVNANNQAELLKEVGPHLQDEGLAYWDGDADEWRMNMTESGKLPKSAIEYLARMAHENGIHTDYDKFFDATAAVDQDATGTVNHEFSQGAEYIGKGEGFYHELGQIGVSSDHQAEVLQRAAPELYEQGIAYKMNDGLPGINMTPDHVMPQESLETLHQAAIDSNASDNFTTTHEGIVFDQATDTLSTVATDNSEFSVNDFGKSYDADAQSYYNALNGVDRSHWQALLNEAAPKLQSISYDGQPLTYRTADGWHFREVNQLPSVARKILSSIANKHDWTPAA